MHIAALLLSAALLQAAPTATTGETQSVTTDSAALTGTVNPNGQETNYHFEYGTTTSYGTSTTERSAGNGTSPVSVREPLDDLKQGTTYHYRLVAGSALGEDETFKTEGSAEPAPRAPTISSRAPRAIAPTGATLRAGVNPRGLGTLVRIEYGPTLAYGNTTGWRGIGAGKRTRGVAIIVTGLAPHTRYYYRAVATNGAGLTYGASRSFTTRKTPTGVTINPSTRRPVWGSGLIVRGRVATVGSTLVALEKQDFPYSGEFTPVATARAGRHGAFRLTAPPLFTSALLRVVTRSAVPAYSPLARASVAVRVSLKRKRLRHKRYRLQGTIWPAVPKGRVSLQRQSRSGHWFPVKRKKARARSGDRSRYRFTVRRRHRTHRYRVAVVAHDGGAHVPGRSRTTRIPRR
ncbi:MAG TPA: hypothetical protein VFG79_23355 [Solirubrobacter sp.]|nr:hypothetical protein [Solirubrobacter sp.]